MKSRYFRGSPSGVRENRPGLPAVKPPWRPTPQNDVCRMALTTLDLAGLKIPTNGAMTTEGNAKVKWLRGVLDALPDPILVLSKDRRCEFANTAFFSFFPVGRQAESGDPNVSVDRFWQDLGTADLRKEELRCQWILNSKDSYSVKLALYPLEDGFTLVRVMAGSSSNDAMSVFHAQRLETLGMLAGGVAHDFNNVLTGILGHLAFLKTILPTSGPHLDSLKAIHEGARKATALSQQILNFSKLDTTEESVEVDFGDLVARMVGLLRGSISPLCRLEFIAPESRMVLLGSEGRLAQVIVNLAVNARDALGEEGDIKIDIGSCGDLKRLEGLFGTKELACSCYSVLRVQDNGQGMPQEVMDRMFEPYFTTKRGKGTGLGLSTVAAIVRELGGAIAVQSEVNVGTLIEVFFPLVQAPADARAEETGVGEIPKGKEKILIVDDEYSVRNVLALSLQHLGYAVEVAASGVEALELYEQAATPFELVILDMLMPQLPGEKVFMRLKELDAKVRVLLISGFASQEAVRSVLDSGGLGFIQKPFTIEDLAKTVRECFDRGAPSKSVVF